MVQSLGRVNAPRILRECILSRDCFFLRCIKRLHCWDNAPLGCIAGFVPRYSFVCDWKTLAHSDGYSCTVSKYIIV